MCDNFENGHDIEGGELTCEEPKITWEWYPGDVGPYGDGVLIITAKGDGFVMLEADERSRTGQDEASMNIKAEYGQTIIAEAYIARAGTAVSPTARRVIVVPEKDQQSEPAPGPQPAPETKCPVLAFGDENGKQINEISLAPGQKKKVQIILTEHPESFTRAFQAQWIMYDSKHKPTGGITCEEDPSTKKWFFPLNLSTSAESQGGMKGNTTSSARFQSSNWRCVAYNSLGKLYWHPRGEFTTPIAVAEFTIQAPSDWNDAYATIEIDPKKTQFVLTADTTPFSNGYEVYLDYTLVLTVKNKNKHQARRE